MQFTFNLKRHCEATSEGSEEMWPRQSPDYEMRILEYGDCHAPSHNPLLRSQ